jgi:drug/metabolite transporter (DMT)-like permease
MTAASRAQPSARAVTAGPDPATAFAFLGIVVLGGMNAVGVRFSNQELAPFWGATLRFGIAAIVLVVIVALRRVPLPRGAALKGSLLYGVVGFGAAFGLLYWALVRTPAGVGQLVLALVPLLTLLFAVGQGLERLRPQSLIGAALAIAGVAIVFGGSISAAVPLASLLAVLAAAACMAESNVIVKRYPKCHPVANNAIAMTTGAVIVFAISLLAGEPHVLPSQPRTWVAVLYIALAGSVAVFSLFMYVIQRWTASATSYVMLLMPLVTVAVAAVLAGEGVTIAFVLGAAIVLAGVYVGAFAPHLLSRGPARAAAPLAGTVATAAPAVTPLTLSDVPAPVGAHPGCA